MTFPTASLRKIEANQNPTRCVKMVARVGIFVRVEKRVVWPMYMQLGIRLEVEDDAYSHAYIIFKIFNIYPSFK